MLANKAANISLKLFVTTILVLTMILGTGSFVHADIPDVWYCTGTITEAGIYKVCTELNDYTPESTVNIAGAGFLPETSLTIKVTRPDGSVITGDGSCFTEAGCAEWPTEYDTITTDSNGEFQFDYVLDGIVGLYNVDVIQDGEVIATHTFLDSKNVVFKQSGISSNPGAAITIVSYHLDTSGGSTVNLNYASLTGAGTTRAVNDNEVIQIDASAPAGYSFVNWAASNCPGGCAAWVFDNAASASTKLHINNKAGTLTANFVAVALKSNGDTCTAGSECTSGNCVDGYCCNSACDGACDSCSIPGSIGTCTFLSAGTECRSSAGVCDVAETCSGSSATCPADIKLTSVCRPAANICDIAESCDGTNNDCPTNSFQTAGTPCPDSLFCNGVETCDGSGTCQSGTAVSCSGNDIAAIGICTNTPDDNDYTWDFFAGFTSSCIEETSSYSCTTGTLSVTSECSFSLCSAECDATHSCADSQCSETYNDYCTDLKLTEYDTNKILDSTTITDSATNTCLGSCFCTDNPVDCSAPATNTYCVKDVCGATCDSNDDCADTECDDNDGCYYEGVLSTYGIMRDYSDVTNNCLGTCSCEANTCDAYTAETDNDGDGYSPSCGDCNDNNASINPGATEIAGDGVDQNCDGREILIVTADLQIKTYGDLNPTLTFSYAGFMGTDDYTVLNTEPSATTTATQYSDVGDYPITLSGGDDDIYYFTYVNSTLKINKATLTVTADSYSHQYSDAVLPAPLTYDLQGFKGSDDSSVITGLSTLNCTTIPADTQFSAAGNYPITCDISGLSAINYNFTAVNGVMTVTKENVAIAYTGDLFAFTAGPNINTAPISLSAHLTQEADGYDGDLSLAKVTFMLIAPNAGGSVIIADIPVNSAGDAFTTATVPVGTYQIFVRISNGNMYWIQRPGGTGTLNVALGDNEQRVTGGGWIPDALSNNGKDNFGFTVYYNKKGAPKGNFLFMFRGTDGYDYQLKSNSWAKGGLSFSGENGAFFTAKATLSKIDQETGEVVDSDGSYTFAVNVKDLDTNVKTKTPDTFAITIFDGSNNVWKQVGTAGSQIPIGGGNIVVHSK